MNEKIKNHVTGFTDLPEDVHFLIIENLDINDLLSLAETNNLFSSLAADAFKRKYSDTFVEFRYKSYDKNSNVCETNGRIYLQFETVIIKFLKRFGRSISKIKVNFSESEYTKNAMLAISKWINIYCSENLSVLILYDTSDSFFGQVTKPFKNLKEIEIFGKYNNVKSDTLELNEILPAIEHLMLYCVRFSNIDQIYRHYPHMTELGVSYYDVYERTYPRKFEEHEIEQLIRLNPQIRKLIVHGPTEYTLRVANEALPELEYLGIEPTWFSLEVSDDAPLITYKNVKILNIDVLQASEPLTHFPQCIAFENLEEFYTTPVPEQDWWIQFIEENVQLKKFGSSSGCIRNDDLMKFAMMNNSSLNEISLAICRDVDQNSIIKFIEQQQTVKIFQFKRSQLVFQNIDESFELKAHALYEKFNDDFAIRTAADSIELKRY